MRPSSLFERANQRITQPSRRKTLSAGQKCASDTRWLLRQAGVEAASPSGSDRIEHDRRNPAGIVADR
jgi:hypothetical protein